MLIIVVGWLWYWGSFGFAGESLGRLFLFLGLVVDFWVDCYLNSFFWEEVAFRRCLKAFGI